MLPSSTFTISWKRLFKEIRVSLRAAIAVLIGENCVICGCPLSGEDVCPGCWASLTYTCLRGAKGNVLDRLFWGEPRVLQASAFIWYKPEFDISKIVHAFKYQGNRRLARTMGRLMAIDLQSTSFFTEVDALVPVPLSRERYRKRGYNQSELLAEGIREIIHIPLITTAIIRIIDNPSQTTRVVTERHENVKGIFSVVDGAALKGKHICLIDDVITVGATLLSLISTLDIVPELRISVLTLCAAGHYHQGRVLPQDLNLPDNTAMYNPDSIRKYNPHS